MKKFVLGTMLLVAACLISGCGNSVPREEYDRVVAELEAVKQQAGLEQNSQEGKNALGALHKEEALAKLETQKYLWNSTDYSHAALIVRNNTEFTLQIDAKAMLLDESGALVGAKKETKHAVETGKEVCFYFLDQEAFADFDYQLDIAEERYFESMASSLSYQTNMTREKVILSITNGGSKPAENVSFHVLFFDKGEPVGMRTGFAMDSNDRIEPGKTEQEEVSFDADSPFDSVQVFLEGRLAK